jgi:hypothetical protein
MIKCLVDAKGNEGGVVIYCKYTPILLECLKDGSTVMLQEEKESKH